MKKTILLALTMVLLSGMAFGTAVNAPKEIPANINWSFSVELNSSNSFTETQIFFDNTLIVTAFNDKQPVIQSDFVLKAFSFDKVPADNTGLTVFISYFGIQEGIHKIKTKTFNESSLTEEQEFELTSVDTVNAIKNLPNELSQDTQILMKDLINKINDDRTKLEELKNSTEQNLDEKTKVLENEIIVLENALNELNAQKEAELKEAEQKETEKLQESTGTEKENALTGFYNFSVDHAWYGIVFLLALLVLLALFQLYKTKTSDTIFEETLEDKGIKEEKQEIEEEKKARFSFSEKKQEKKSARLSIGDLLRK